MDYIIETYYLLFSHVDLNLNGPQRPVDYSVPSDQDLGLPQVMETCLGNFSLHEPVVPVSIARMDILVSSP